MKLFSNRKRPVHLGPFPLERLRRLGNPVTTAGSPAPRPPAPPPNGFARTVQSYLDAFLASDKIPVASERVPLPDDPAVVTNELKAACYFLNATQVGACQLEDGISGGNFAIVFLVEHGRTPETENLASDWVKGTAHRCSALRGAEIAQVISGYIKQLGFPASVHAQGVSDLDLGELARRAGLVEQNGSGSVAPFIGERFAIAAVVTSLLLQVDRPLVPGATSPSPMSRFKYWLGMGTGTSGMERNAQRRRASHLGHYPMETIRRSEKPTTLIFDDEVPRVPQRAAFFRRAGRGDLGDKAQRELPRFAMKYPLAYAMAPLIRIMSTMQDGDVTGTPGSGTSDPTTNARAIKSLAYYLNADMAAICEAPAYAWYSHDTNGRPITRDHRYAITLLIDQGHDTMEGASGDDWISGSQSMRAYMRGAEIAGLMAAQIRSLGYSARAQTNTDSEVLHLPLLLLSGLGELSRVGELVLNPFLGPRSKSVVITTDMPLEADKPIDFGLQDTCNKCRKCARECPCNAISYKDKVMFNGYEMWKPDVERCARYRITNPRGSACGRCMKVCPYTNEGLLTHRVFLWAALHLPFTRRTLVRLDDWVRHGARNPIKKWWRDLERHPDGIVRAATKAHARDLMLDKSPTIARTQQIAYYPASVMPSPDDMNAVPIDRVAALQAASGMETPVDALMRRQRGESPPTHYASRHAPGNP